MNFDRYIEIVKNISKHKPINDNGIENMLFWEELGIDSILLIYLLVTIENELGKELSFDKIVMYSIKTPIQLWKALGLDDFI